MNAVRKIVFAGYDTLSHGIRIDSERSVVDVGGQRYSSDTVPYRDGALTVPAGREPAALSYRLIVRGADRGAVESKCAEIIAAFSGSKGALTDTDFSGKYFANAVFVGADEPEFVSRNGFGCWLTVRFQADPVMMAVGTVNERAFRVTAQGNFTLTVTNNGSWALTNGTKTSSGTFSVSQPYTYRLRAYSETVPAVTLNSTALALETVFTMPANAVFSVTMTGFGYFEMWHDTRGAGT